MNTSNFPLPSLSRNKSIEYGLQGGLPNSKKVVSSRNDMPYHYVIHSDFFQYDAYALHVGQHDRLTFFGPQDAPSVAVHLYDCRHGSPEYDRKMVIDVPIDGSLAISIPPGYAHWFENLENVVTRNDYSLYGPSDASAVWDVLEDNQTYAVERMERARPTVRANTVSLPTEAQFLIGAAVAEGWKGGATEQGSVMSVSVDGVQKSVFVDREWQQPDLDDVEQPSIETADYFVGAFQAIRDESCSLASNTSSGLADSMLIDLSPTWPDQYNLYPRMRLHVSPLLSAGEVEIELVDRRAGSTTFGQRWATSLPADPRIVLRVEPGVALRMRGEGQLCFRVEYDVFVDPIDSPTMMTPAADGSLPAVPEPSGPADPKILRLAAYG